jgi:hypothetical protein
LFEARQEAVNRLHDIVQFGGNKDAVAAADVLLTCYLADIIVDEGDAPDTPCDCPMCDPDNDDRDEIPDDLPGDENLPLIFTYGVFLQ